MGRIPGRLVGRLVQALGLEEHWAADLCRYYQVTPVQALVLGTRQKGRRPDLPGSPTCQPVSGKTWEELWAARPRDSEEAVFSFYKEIGAWAAFRQVVRHRFRSFAFVARHLPRDGVFLEWGCGIAPISHWLATHPWQVSGEPTYILVDVDSEHFTFGRWRVAAADGEVVELLVEAGKPLPALPPVDAACILEVLEHLPDPVAVIRHIGAAIKPGGVLFEDFVRHDAESDGPDLPSARATRPEVYRYLLKHFAFEAGRSWEMPDGGGIRRWRKLR